MALRIEFQRGFLAALALGLFVLVACREEPAATPTTAAVAPVATATTPPTETPAPPPATPTATERPLPTPTQTATATPEPVATGDEVPRFEEASCRFEVPADRGVTCGYLVVRENRDNPEDEDTLRLHVAIFDSESAHPEPDPIVYLEGGPGGDALEGIPFIFESRFAPFLAEHDFIMFDQRGTGYSQPSLACPGYVDLSLELLDELLSPEEATERYLDMLATCRERLVDEGVDFSAYHSAASAADVNDLRRALGYDEWNLYGISYGTRLALTVMRDYPEGVRSVVLDSAYPLEVNIVLDTPANVDRAFDVFFAGCAADPACSAAYPDLETFFFDLVEQLDAEPITVPVYYAFTGERYDAVLAGDDLIGVLFQGLYSAEIIPSLPRLIYDTAAGDYGLLSTLLSNFLLNAEFISVGMQFAVQCHEEIPFATPGEPAQAVAAYPRLEDFFAGSLDVGESAFEACALWQAGKAAPIENQAVSSDIPTLVLAGEYDPITPPAWGQEVADELDNVFYFEFPGLGHGVSVLGECPLQLTLDFLDDPTARPSADCITAMAGPDFVVPGGETAAMELVPFTIDIFGTTLTGVVPEGWEEVTPGVFARQATGLDQTVIIQQAASGISAEQLLGALVNQLGIDTPDVLSTQEAGGRTWSLYETEAQGLPINLALAEEETITYIVLLISSPDEQPALYDAVFLPALENIEVSETS